MRSVFIHIILRFGLSLALWSGLGGVVAQASEFQLADTCPPGFLLVEPNQCELRNLYQLYPSLQNSGVGGLKSGVPDIREGFSPQQIDLGRLMFFDPLLSADSSVSCASCHHPDMGFSDGRDRSIGIENQVINRSAPSLWNVGFLRRLFWDGRASSLEEQIQGPLYDAKEMGNNPAHLLTSLNNNTHYVDLFQQAFAGSQGISLDQIYTALAAFEASLISLNSRYDQYAHGYADALSKNEIEGLNVFRSFVARCSECHTPPLFTNQEMAVIGTPDTDGMPFDTGQAAITGDASQRGSFKVPSIRNIALTAPYMHSGKFTSLRDTVEFYTLGRGHAVPEGESLNIHWHIWEPKLSDRELDQIVEFLQTLTDESLKPMTPKEVPSGLKPFGINPIEGA
ncbi:MAG: cytochrome c peroxidase [Pseudomonadales bacterium]